MKPKTIIKHHGREHTRTPQAHAMVVLKHFRKTLDALRAVYEGCPDDTKDLLQMNPLIMKVML